MEECLDDEFAVNTSLFQMEDFESAMQAHDDPEVSTILVRYYDEYSCSLRRSHYGC